MSIAVSRAQCRNSLRHFSQACCLFPSQPHSPQCSLPPSRVAGCDTVFSSRLFPSFRRRLPVGAEAPGGFLSARKARGVEPGAPERAPAGPGPALVFGFWARVQVIPRWIYLLINRFASLLERGDADLCFGISKHTQCLGRLGSKTRAKWVGVLVGVRSESSMTPGTRNYGIETYPSSKPWLGLRLFSAGEVQMLLGSQTLSLETVFSST